MFFVKCKVSKKGNPYVALMYENGEREFPVTFDRLILYRITMAKGQNIDEMVPGEEFEV